jgi:hypothetical protein
VKSIGTANGSVLPPDTRSCTDREYTILLRAESTFSTPGALVASELLGSRLSNAHPAMTDEPQTTSVHAHFDEVFMLPLQRFQVAERRPWAAIRQPHPHLQRGAELLGVKCVTTAGARDENGAICAPSARTPAPSWSTRCFVVGGTTEWSVIFPQWIDGEPT